MPFANNKGVRIYYEVEGQGPPLVLAHGMGAGGDLNAWRSTGYTEALKDDYSLILFDIRGHGRSDKPGQSVPESNPVDDIVAVLDELEVEQAHFLGYSMGAAAGFRQAVNHPDRFYSFMLGGMTPGKWPDEMVRAMSISAELTRLRRTDREAYFVRLEQMLGHALTPAEKAQLLARDVEGGEEEPTLHSQELALTDEQLKGITVPCLLYCGDKDPFHAGAQAAVQVMPRAVFISMDGLDHITAFFRSDVVSRVVRQFIGVVGGMRGQG